MDAEPAAIELVSAAELGLPGACRSILWRSHIRNLRSSLRAFEPKVTLAFEMLRRSRALSDVESLAQKPARAIVPRPSLRGPAVQSSSGSRHASSVRFSFDDGDPHPSQHFASDGHGGRLAAAALGDPQEDASHLVVGANRGPGGLLQDPPQLGEPVLAMCPIRCFPPEAKTRGLSPAKRPIALRWVKRRKSPTSAITVAAVTSATPGKLVKNPYTSWNESRSNHFADGPLGLGDLPLGERQLIDALPEHRHVPRPAAFLPGP